METITIDLEKTLEMLVDNEMNSQEGMGNNDGRIIINPLNHVEYHFPGPGTYYPNCKVVNPEDLFDMETVQSGYGNLDIGGSRADANAIVQDKNGKDVGDFEEEDSEEVAELVNEWVGELKATVKANTLPTVEIEGAEYQIEWI